MKKVVLLAFAMASMGSALAQVVTSYPYTEDFDTFPVDNVTFGPGAEPNPFPNNWDNYQADAASQDWYGRSVATGSSGTGPTSDHTGSGNYVFVEDGWGNNTDVTLRSPQFVLNGPGGIPTLSFWVHSQTGSSNPNELFVEVYSSSSSTWTRIDTILEESPTGLWVEKIYDLSAYQNDTVQIAFVVDNSTNSFQHDIAIDDFSMYYAILTASASAVSNNTCANESNGSAAVSWVFNSGATSVAWSNGATTDTITGLADGTYDVTVTDAAGTTSTASATVSSSFGAPVFTASATDITCNGFNDGMAQVDSVTAFTPFVPACGDTSIISMDTNNPTIVAVDTSSSGTNSTTGYPAIFGNWYWGAKHQIIYRASELTAAGFSAGYFTSISVPVSQVNGTNNYSNFRFSMGCTSDSTADVWQSGLMEVSFDPSITIDTGMVQIDFHTPYFWDGTSNLVVESCFNNTGFTNNSATPYTNVGYTAVRYYRADISTVCSNTTSTTGTSFNRPNLTFRQDQYVPLPSFSYAWSNGDTTASISGLSAGTYTVTLMDAYCSSVDSVTVAEPALLTATVTVDSNISCNGLTDGGLSVAAAGGAGGSGGPALVISEVDPGSPDFIEITNVSGGPFDATGYKVATSNSYTAINTINSLTWDLTGTWAANEVQYREDATGANYWGNNLFYNSGSPGWVVLVDPSGNVADIMFWGWSAADIATFSVTVGGNTVTAAGAWSGAGVNATCSNSYTRTGTSDNDDNSDWSCIATSKGALNAGMNISGGGASYSYLWSNGATVDAITGLSAAVYTVTVTDGNGCSTTGSGTITEPAAIVASAAIDSNTTCNGGSNGSATMAAIGGTMPYAYNWSNADTTATATSLGAGTYYVTLTDANGCTETDSVVITEPTPVVASTVVDNDVSCNGGSDGQATASATGGTMPYSYLWTNGTPTDVNSGLAAGTYSVIATDANGCTGTAAATIAEPTAISTALSSSDVDCYGDATGSASAIGGVSGGTAPYTYSWSNGGSTDSVGALTAGDYVLTVTDANGCTVTDSVNITQNDSIGIQFTVTNTTCEGGDDGSVSATVSGGVAGYGYSWSTGATSDTITGLMTGSYDVTITDMLGCQSSATGTVDFDNPLPVVNLGADTAVGPINTVTLNSGYPNDNNLWSSGATTSSLDVVVTADTTVWVTVTTSAGCVGSDTIVIGALLSANGVTKEVDMKLFPNPTNGQVYLEIQDLNANEVSVQILDYSGKLVMERNWDYPSNFFRQQFDLSNQSQGMYFVNILIDGHRHTERITVY